MKKGIRQRNKEKDRKNKRQERKWKKERQWAKKKQRKERRKNKQQERKRKKERQWAKKKDKKITSPMNANKVRVTTAQPCKMSEVIFSLKNKKLIAFEYRGILKLDVSSFQMDEVVRWSNGLVFEWLTSNGTQKPDIYLTILLISDHSINKLNVLFS